MEPDLTNAGPFLAAALVSGGTVRVPGWPQHTTQAGDALRDILDAMGADVSLDREGLTVPVAVIVGVDVDLHDASELTPVIAALAALADSPTVIRGVAHIRGHETDRLAALAAELTALGGRVRETEDGLRIDPASLHGGTVPDLCGPPDGDGRRRPRARRPAASSSRTSATVAKTLPRVHDAVGADARRRPSRTGPVC